MRIEFVLDENQTEKIHRLNVICFRETIESLSNHVCPIENTPLKPPVHHRALYRIDGGPSIVPHDAVRRQRM